MWSVVRSILPASTYVCRHDRRTRRRASSHGRHDASPCTSCLNRLDHRSSPDSEPECDRIERRSPSRVTNSLPSRFPGQIFLADQMSPGASVSLPVRASLLYSIRRSRSRRGANGLRGKERYSRGRTVLLIYRKHPSPGGSALLCQTFTRSCPRRSRSDNY